MLKEIVLVGLGGGAGSILRYLTSVWLGGWNKTGFPWATFTVNMLGCLVIGMLIGLLVRQPEEQQLRLLLITGFCGGYTTFSTFASENLALIQSGQMLTVAAYVLSSTVLGVLLVATGCMVVK